MMIYTKYTTTRLKYVLDYIFVQGFRTNYRLTDRIEELEHHNGCRIAYADESPEFALHVPFAGLLAENGVRQLDLKIHTGKDVKWLFYLPGGKGLQYDIFSAVFYMISRYEEYLPFEPDRYGRFEAPASLAAREGFLEIPVVDLWREELRNRILEHFPDQHMPDKKFRYLPTVDVDQPYAVLHRGVIRTLGGHARSWLQADEELKMRRNVLKGQTRDPFDTFDDIEWLHSRYGMKPLIFFLCAPYARYDKSIPPHSQAFTRLVRRTARFAGTGIHPSYRSFGHKARMGREIRTLEKIAGERPRASRQHYLKIQLPQTYRDLIAQGISEDYSMGYASAAGFRAGTCMPWFFYDLEQEQETPLKVVPFQLMDRSMKDYMGLSAGDAFQLICKMADRVFDAGGTLVTVWHNETFSNHGEWKGWREVYVRMLDYIAKKQTDDQVPEPNGD